MLGAWWRQRRNDWLDYPLRQGTVWAGKYRVERPLGMGSYGQAYRCTDLRTGAAVLMKRSKPSKREAGREMLRRESELMRRLRHPQIPQWLDEAVHRNETILVTELVEGDNLEQSIMELGYAYTEREALTIVLQVLRPLRYLHEAGYVHRDVRIPNVIRSGESVWLIDFGLACQIGEEQPDKWRGAEELPEAGGVGNGWSAVKRRMRKPEPSSDLNGLGHLFLFLMYAGYVSREGQEERGWEEELTLQPPVKRFLTGLLEGRWKTAADCERELERLLTELR